MQKEIAAMVFEMAILGKIRGLPLKDIKRNTEIWKDPFVDRNLVQLL